MDYIIKYTAEQDKEPESGKIRVKNKDSDEMAKYFFRGYMRRHGFKNVKIVSVEQVGDIINDIFKIFGMK